MAIVYRSAGAWGAGKGSPLTAAEVDGNFWDLASRILELENNGVQPKQIYEIQVVGNQMTILLDDLETEFGPFELPVATFNWRDDGYVPGIVYKPNDVFATDDGIYLVQVEHTAASEFNPDEFNSEGEFYKQIFGASGGGGGSEGGGGGGATEISIGFFFPDLVGKGIPNNRAMFGFVADRAFYLPANLDGTFARLGTPPVETLEFSIRHNGFIVGFFTFESGQQEPIIDFVDPIQFVPGDTLMVYKPDFDDITEEVSEGTTDIAAKNLFITFRGILGTMS